MALRHILRGIDEKGLDPKMSHKDVAFNGTFKSEETTTPVVVVSVIEVAPVEVTTPVLPEVAIEEPSKEEVIVAVVETQTEEQVVAPEETAVVEVVSEEPVVEPTPAEEKTENVPALEEDKESTDSSNLSKKKRKLSKSEGNPA